MAASEIGMLSAERAFINYTDPYKCLGEPIELKIEHTLRVKSLCIALAEKAGTDPKEKDLACLCGLLHDIGRFEQWKRYRTYDDAKSADHGDLGAEILIKDSLIDRFSESSHSLLLNVVRYHNKYEVPVDLCDRDRFFANLTRDADKIDVLFMYASGNLTKSSGGSALSDSVLQTLLSQKEIRNQDIRTKADRAARYLALVFGLKFRRSFEIVRQSGYIDKVIDIQLGEAANGMFREQLENLRAYLNGYLAEKSR